MPKLFKGRSTQSKDQMSPPNKKGKIQSSAATPTEPPSESKLSVFDRLRRRLPGGTTVDALDGPANSPRGQNLGLPHRYPLTSVSDSQLPSAQVPPTFTNMSMVRPGTSSSFTQLPTTTGSFTECVPRPPAQLQCPTITPMTPCALIRR